MMTPEQFDLFKTAVIAAIDQHLADGGKLMHHGFGSGTTKCPVECAVSRTPNDYNTSVALSRTLGFQVDDVDMWSFIDGFDDIVSSIFVDSRLYRLGQELRQTYVDHILPRSK